MRSSYVMKPESDKQSDRLVQKKIDKQIMHGVHQIMQ